MESMDKLMTEGGQAAAEEDKDVQQANLEQATLEEGEGSVIIEPEDE